MVSREKVDPAWSLHITKYCKDYSESDYFLRASAKQASYSFLGYGLYLGLLMNAYYFKGRARLSSGSRNCCTQLMKYIGRLFFTVMLTAPWIAILIYTSYMELNMWINFGVNAVFIIILTATPTLFLDNLCGRLGLYSFKL